MQQIHEFHSVASCTYVGLVALFITMPLMALEGDRNQPLDVESDQFHSDQQKNITLLSGNVRIIQGTLKGESDKATVYQNADNDITRVVMVGKPARMAQQLDSDGGMMHARAVTIDYHADTDIAEMSGDAHVVQEGRGEFSGDHIVYNTKTGEVTSGSNQPGNRVHLRMQPKTQATSDSTPVSAKTKEATAVTPAPVPQKKHTDKQR